MFTTPIERVTVRCKTIEIPHNLFNIVPETDAIIQ